MHRALSALVFLVYGSFLFSQTIYVDPLLTASCSGTYSIENRDCNGTDGDAYKTLTAAANAASAGTRVLIREGVYEEQLSPKKSGEEGKYITYKNYGDEVAEITGESLSPAIWIDQKDYIIIDGLKIHNVRRWLNCLGSSHVIIRNNDFDNALDGGGSSKTGLFFQSCNNVKILNNSIINSTQDNVGMIACDHSLIEGNTIKVATHVLWTLKCSNNIIVRGNYFHNEIQKIGEVYDCTESGYGSNSFPKLTSEDDTKYNVIEDNIFAYTASSGDHSPFSGIQYAGQNGIIRNNIFYECVGPPISLTIYTPGSEYNYGNRISHNVFYDNDYGGIEITGSDTDNFGDQQIKNNIFYKNQFIANDTRWSWFDELDEKPVQIFMGRNSDILFESNNIFSSEVDELYVVVYGSRTSSSNDAPQSLSWWEENHSDIFKSNLQVNPDFVDEATYDFQLKANSSMIDAGMFLTKTVSAGSESTSMEVEDAGWFMNGFGLVTGDEIQLEGQSEYALVLSIDYTKNTLTLDRALSWDAGIGVSLRYDGSEPDLGLLEYPPVYRTGISSRVLDVEKIKVYPNPTSGLLHVDTGREEQIEKVSVFDLSGKQVMVAYSSEVNISALYSGIYFMNLTCKNGRTLMEKVVKY